MQTNRQYRFVKDQFEVVPRKDLLIHEGFMAPPKGHELELVDLEKPETASPPQDSPPNRKEGSKGKKSASKDHSAPPAEGAAVKNPKAAKGINNSSAGAPAAAQKKPPGKPKPRPGSAQKVHPTGADAD